MKSFDDFLNEFNENEEKLDFNELVNNSSLTTVEKTVSMLVKGMSLVDKRSENRLRAYHDWVSKNS